MREESYLRPANEPDDAEFDELWGPDDVEPDGAPSSPKRPAPAPAAPATEDAAASASATALSPTAPAALIVETTPARFLGPSDWPPEATARALAYTSALPTTVGGKRQVIVWDLDETLIVFQSLADQRMGRSPLAALRKVRRAAVRFVAAPPVR